MSDFKTKCNCFNCGPMNNKDYQPGEIINEYCLKTGYHFSDFRNVLHKLLEDKNIIDVEVIKD